MGLHLFLKYFWAGYSSGINTLGSSNLIALIIFFCFLAPNQWKPLETNEKDKRKPNVQDKVKNIILRKQKARNKSVNQWIHSAWSIYISYVDGEPLWLTREKTVIITKV